MQLMPDTAEAHLEGDLLDPEQNIAAGARYLRRLGGIFSRRFDNPEDVLNFTLAAYHAGEGSILDSLSTAESLGTRWDSGDDEYVQRVMEVYDAFCKICP